MKRNWIRMMAVLLIACLLTGCTGTIVVVQQPTTGAAEPEVSAPGAVKIGLAVTTTVAESTSATAEAAGAIKFDITMAAVAVDANGVIRACKIDSVPATVAIDGTGAITSDLTAEVLTKDELGENYGMKAWGGAVAEWDEQVAALCEFAVGKTVEELKNGAVDETGKAPAGTDLATSATIYLGGYVNAIEAAVNNAQTQGAQSSDTLALVTLNSLGSSVAATAEKAGTAQLDVTIGVVASKDGVVTACYIDAVQAKVSFDTTGTITTDLSAPIQTKNELGENYGMKAWGGAIAEWDEQAASFAKYVIGKNAGEITGIAVTESTKPAEGTDLAASVTISIGDFQALVVKALNQ